MKTVNVANLDFDSIRADIREYMSTRDEFTDLNFEASGLSWLLDLLAYNTSYYSVYANFIANEQFLDTAAKRSSVLSHARSLGYSPRGWRAARATINFTINTLTLSPGVTAPPSFVMPRGTTFTALVNNTAYSYVTTSDYSAVLDGGKYYFTNIELAEGTYFVSEFTVVQNTTPIRLLLPNSKVDSSTLRMMIKTSETNDEVVTWQLANGVLSLDENSEVFFIQEVEGDKYEVYFGNGLIGAVPDISNIVHCEYVSCNGVAGNGASVFTPMVAISHEGRGTAVVDEYVITTMTSATGGSDSESIEEIRLNASSAFVAQNRAVTAEDYKAIIRANFANIHNIRVWGGEQNDPPQFGRVYVSIYPQYGDRLTELEKTSIRDIVATKSVANIQLEFVDHEFLALEVDTSVYYDATKLPVNINLQSAIFSAIEYYNSTYLNNFDSIFRYSRFTRLLDDVNTAVTSNITSVRMRKEFNPELGKARTYQIKYLNPFRNENNIISTSSFTVFGYSQQLQLYNIGSTIYLGYRNSSNQLVYFQECGTIDFSKGIINLNNINFTSYIGGSIAMTIKPLSNDIVSNENVVLRLSNNQVNVKIIPELVSSHSRIVTPSV